MNRQRANVNNSKNNKERKQIDVTDQEVIEEPVRYFSEGPQCGGLPVNDYARVRFVDFEIGKTGCANPRK